MNKNTTPGTTPGTTPDSSAITTSHLNQKSALIVGITVFIITFVATYSILRSLRPVPPRQPDYAGDDPPLSQVNHDFPLSAQLLPTQCRTAALQILSLFDQHRMKNGLYPYALICGNDYQCEIPDLDQFRNGYSMLYARASAIQASSIPNEYDQERLDLIHRDQLAVLKKDLGFYAKKYLANPQIQNDYYDCAFLAPVASITELTHEEQLTLVNYCFNAQYEGRQFTPDYTADALAVDQKLSTLIRNHAAPNYDWSKDELITSYSDESNIDPTHFIDQHVYFVTDLAAVYFWPAADFQPNETDKKNLLAAAQRYYLTALSDYYFAQAKKPAQRLPPNYLLTYALATSRLIAMQEDQDADVTELKAFRQQLLLDFRRSGLNSTMVQTMPLDNVASLSFAVDQLLADHSLATSNTLLELRQAIIDRMELSTAGTFTGFFDAYESTADGQSLLASFNLRNNSLLAAFIFHHFPQY